MEYIRLPLQKAYNVRDLGGYPTTDGAVTKWRRFLRADDLSSLSPEDIAFLLKYGVVGVVDLRSHDEVEKKAHPFAGHPEVGYINIPLITGDVEDATQYWAHNPTDFLAKFYVQLLETKGNEIHSIFDFFAKHTTGCLLFHCAAGKDRTGVLAMLLLGLAGVSTMDLIANYETTFAHLQNNPSFQVPSEYPPEVMHSKAESIIPAIRYIVDTHGSFENYVLSAGVAKDTVNLIKASLVSREIS